MQQDNEPRRRVLYMEDDPGLARLVQKSLERSGFDVATASDGRLGLELMKEEPFDLVLVDYNMPNFDGLEVIRVLARSEERIPAIMLTGAGDESIAVTAMKAGAADYMVKDSDQGFLQLLPTIIERAIEQEALRRAQRAWERERERLILDLQQALADVKRLSGLLPICASCKKIRDDHGYWNQLESYIGEHSDAEFSHSLCPDCVRTLYPDFYPSGNVGSS